MADSQVVVHAEDPAFLENGTETEKPTPSGLPDGSLHLIDLKQQYEINELNHRLDQMAADLTHDNDLHELRKRYSLYLFVLVVVWVVTVWATLVFQGFGKFPHADGLAFSLSDTVLVAFITSTTASVLGLFGIAAYWMFGGKKPSKDSA